MKNETLSGGLWVMFKKKPKASTRLVGVFEKGGEIINTSMPKNHLIRVKSGRSGGYIRNDYVTKSTEREC